MGEGLDSGPLIQMTEVRYSFPTIGEVVRELFNAAGILPQKNDETSVVEGEKHKKAIQKSLARLAGESSKIGTQLDDLLNVFGEIVFELVNDHRITLAIMASIEDALEQYRDLVRHDGTYLSLSETIKWVIQYRLLDRVLTSLFKNSLAFDLKASGLSFPEDKFWWLPEVSFDAKECSVQFPIAKVWQWIYSSQGLSQIRFHNPVQGDFLYQIDRQLVEKYKSYERNLESAQRWTSGQQLPSTHALNKALNDSLEALAESSDERYCRAVSPKQIKAYRIALFLGRLTTYCFKSVQNAYGDDYLHELVIGFKKQYLRFDKETCRYRALVQERVDSMNVSVIVREECWHSAVIELWWLRGDKIKHGIQFYSRYMSKNSKHISRLSQYRMLIACIGPAMTYSLIKHHENPTNDLMPSNFSELLKEGFELKKKATSLKEIQDFEKRVEIAELGELLSWLVEWGKAIYYYRNEDYQKAHPHFEQAFSLARYSAGEEQYLLVNQYIESSAKADNYREFKKAVAWANYLGIRVRWLRGMEDPESEESLRTVYAFMKTARYWQL